MKKGIIIGILVEAKVFASSDKHYSVHLAEHCYLGRVSAHALSPSCTGHSKTIDGVSPTSFY